MKKKIIAPLAIALFVLASGSPAQEQPMKVKGGHELGESAGQFFGEGQEKDVLAACAAGDFKGVNKSAKRLLKVHCDELAGTRQRATGGKREEYQSAGDPSELRKDTFTFDGGHLVKVELVYAIPSVQFNYRGLSFEKIFAGVKEAYGPPTSETSAPVQDGYGVPYLAHRELWLAPQSAILITEQPGRNGSTTLTAFTRAEYERTAAGAPKPANPLE